MVVVLVVVRLTEFYSSTRDFGVAVSANAFQSNCGIQLQVRKKRRLYPFRGDAEILF